MLGHAQPIVVSTQLCLWRLSVGVTALLSISSAE